MSQPIFIDALITQITATPNPQQLNQAIKTGIPKDSRETLFSSFLSNNQDPLAYLSSLQGGLRSSTLGALYILSSRLNADFRVSPPPPWDVVREFCRSFIPEHARLVPERVTKLAKGIHRTAQLTGNPSAAIAPLKDLVTRYPPSPAHLTTVHPVFLLACVSTRHFTPALPILSQPITEISLIISPDLTYNDNLTYHYTGGIALAAMKRWEAAEDFFEIVVTAPGTYPAALQLEALKKLRLVQLISKGKTTPLPKYASPILIRLLKNTPYNAFTNAYPHNTKTLNDILEKDKSLFTQEKTIGLISQAIARAPRWQLKKLTATYVTLHLNDIAKAIGIEKEEDVRRLLLSMIESSDISASIAADGSVTFSDPPPKFTKAQVDEALAGVQDQSRLLQFLEMEMSRNRDYLTKAIKGNGGGGGMASAIGLGEESVWDEEGYGPAHGGPVRGSSQIWDEQYV